MVTVADNAAHHDKHPRKEKQDKKPAHPE